MAVSLQAIERVGRTVPQQNRLMQLAKMIDDEERRSGLHLSQLLRQATGPSGRKPLHRDTWQRIKEGQTATRATYYRIETALNWVHGDIERFLETGQAPRHVQESAADAAHRRAEDDIRASKTLSDAEKEALITTLRAIRGHTHTNPERRHNTG